METRTEYQKGLINLIYTLSSDGARFKRLSKRAAIPVLLRVEGVDVETRTGGKCLTLVSMTYSEGGVQKNMLDAFVRSSLDILKDMDLRVEMDGTTITFRMTLMSYICDMKESYAISGLPNWYNIEGCSKCSITGVKIGNGKVSFNEMYTSPQRTDDSILYSAEKGIRGYTKPGVPVVFQFINPSKLTLDPFHLRGAGVCKYIVEEVTKPTRWNTLKLKRKVLDEMAEALNDVKEYTLDPVKMLNLKKVGKSTGREIDKLSIHISAYLGWTEGPHIPDQLRNVKTESPHYPSTPSRKRPQQVDLRASLDGSIKNGKLDILSAGRALHTAYQSGQYGIPEDVESFLTKHSLDVPLPKLPQSVFTGLTPEAGALLHGYGIVAQLSLNAVQKLLSEQKSTQKISGEQLFGISDAPFAVKLRCNYPDFPPFSNYLFDILGKSCTVQTDIQRFWLIPGERKTSYGTPSPFPKELYDNLYKLFLDFFQLDDQLFDEPEYRSEFGNSRLLKNYATEEAKKKKFVQVSSAKKSFKTNTFRAQFKNALKELRLGTFIIADGSSQGYFARRKRHIAKSKAHEAGEEEEES
ncbi:hypothetical protein L3Y34_004645 [Caenorhabditis briggsae]|uniref:Uncharacterized protein n=1 Tax=Caenorhabditis briggsae TaxID=6238 RepID=A0AAE9ACI3_CAEBR|nr:hypothetical protein L3Y34_004645 [Caenorhabditis briggsae]